MRTTIDINDTLFQEVIQLSHAKTKKEAVKISLESFIKQKRIELLAKRLGKGNISLNLKDLENMRVR